MTAIEMIMSRGRVLMDARRCSALRSAADPTTCAGAAAWEDEAGVLVLGVSVTYLWSRPRPVNA
ncbi:hypothetical protein GCM10022223_01190 [Kineosporia mesophila]|uniref:Uncharacterized protein n=1 Tax=Kineosporia mesophila TaxID=566012 RepID=A0ABP6YWI9_9ACTN